MKHNITEDDEGKSVVNADGENIGMVSEVRGGRAYVDPDPSLTDRIKSKLGWDTDAESEDHPLDESKIDTVTDDEIRLSSDF